MKKSIALFLPLAIFAIFSPVGFGHGGALDSKGGHNDRKKGEYHLHNSQNIQHKSSSVTQDEIGEEFIGDDLYVSDGDTIHVDVKGERKKIRFYGIDSPESTQPYGQEAKEALVNQLSTDTVRVVVMDTDRYGRVVGKVYSQSTYLNEFMVREGYAWWYESYAKSDRRLANLEREARENKRGLWQQKDPEPPWDYRRKSR